MTTGGHRAHRHLCGSASHPAPRAVAKAFGYVGATLLVAVCSAALVGSAGPVGWGLFGASAVTALGFLIALVWGSDHYRLGALRMLLAGFALSEGVFWAHVAQRAGAEALLGAALPAGVTFLASAAWGARTRRDLSGWEPLLFNALLGLLGAVVLAVVLGSSLLVVVVSFAGVLLFSAYTAYDVSEVRVDAMRCTTENELSRLALLAAVALYLDLANLVVDFLNLMGGIAHDTAAASWDILGALADAVGAVVGFVFDLFGGLTP